MKITFALSGAYTALKFKSVKFVILNVIKKYNYYKKMKINMKNLKLITLMVSTYRILGSASKLSAYLRLYFNQIRNLSQENNGESKPIVVYNNAEFQKLLILKENKGKSGVYRWVNKKNGSTYIGSSVNLRQRFYKYYSTSHLQKYKTIIHQALLKYSHSKFSLEIIEYCDKNSLISREQYYIDKLKPDYNILKTANSSLGFKHSQETLDYFKNIRKVSEETKKNLSQAAIGRVLSEAEKSKISASRVGIKLSAKTRAKISATTSSLIGIPVIVRNIHTSLETEYINLTEAAKAIGVSRVAIKKALDSGRILKKTFYVIKREKP